MIDAYHRLFQIEKSFRMSKHDLQARPVYHRTRDSIDAHLTIVFAALAVSRHIEHTLKSCDGQKGRAADLLGINRTTLWKKLRQYGLSSGDEPES